MLLLGSSKFTLTKTTTGVTAYAHSPAGIWKSGTLQRAPGVRSVRPLCPPFLAQACMAAALPCRFAHGNVLLRVLSAATMSAPAVEL